MAQYFGKTGKEPREKFSATAIHFSSGRAYFAWRWYETKQVALEDRAVTQSPLEAITASSLSRFDSVDSLDAGNDARSMSLLRFNITGSL